MTPTTKAGRELFDQMRNWFDNASPELILAIEAEVREDIARQVAALPGYIVGWGQRLPDSISRAAVLALLRAADPLEGRTDE